MHPRKIGTYKAFVKTITGDKKYYINSSLKDFKRVYDHLNSHNIKCSREMLYRMLTDPFKYRYFKIRYCRY